VLLGTPYYVSPEQAQGTASVDHRADLWAMGVIAFECLCGRRPFVADSLVKLLFEICGSAPPVPSLVAHVPAGFDAWFAKALARDPDHRFQSAKELIASLKTVLVPAGISSATDMMTPLPGPFHAQQLAAGHLAHQSGPFAQSDGALLQSNPQGAGGNAHALGRSNPGTFDAIVRNTERSKRRVWGVVGTAALLLSVAIGVGVRTMLTSEQSAERSSASANPRLEEPIAIPMPTASASSEAASEASAATSSDPTTEPPAPSSASAEVPKAPPRAPTGWRPRRAQPPATNRRPPTPPPPPQPELDPFGI
jgi:serine/threonine-protein kinase